MNLASIATKIKLPRGFYKIGLKAKKHAPTIMVATGIGCVVGGTIWACKQTIKANDILQQSAKELDEIIRNQKAAKASGEYSEKDARKDRNTVYSHLAFDMIKTYAAPVIVIGVGLGLIIGSHKVLQGRNTALAAAYSGLLANYNSYRNRVRDLIGKDEEVKIHANVKTEDATVTDEDGNEVEVKNANVIYDDGSGHSVYARIFDEANPNFSKSPSANLIFLRSIQNTANDMLRSQGVLFLNDVYKMLGFEPTSAGQVVGWVWDPAREYDIVNNNRGIDSQGRPGDNMVDFGIYDKLYKSEAKREFLNGVEPCIWLDFNVDGLVYDLL